MFYKNELDIMPGIYKCYGDIRYLRLKIRLEIIKSSMIPLSNVDEQATGLDPQLNERDEFEFTWNEKIFSPREFKYFGDEKNCKTSLEKKYHNEIQRLVSSGTVQPSNRLFTYTSKDEIPVNLHRYIFYHDNYRESSFQDNFISSLTHRHSHISNEKLRDSYSLPVRNIVDYNPSDELKTQNRSLCLGYETMYIFADLSDKSQSSEYSEINERREYLLVSLKWNKRTSTLTVSPDFALFNTAGYKIDYDTLSDTRYVYRYWFSNVSKIENGNHLQKMEKFTDELGSRQKTANLTLDFEIPFGNTENVFVFFEIEKAVGFSGDNMFVQYFTHLPDGWSTNDIDVLSGVSQLCQCGKTEDSVFFSYLFELKLSKTVAKNASDGDDHNSNEDSLPQFFFEICSLDSWKRFRVEGYAWTSLPSTVGRHKLVLNTWRAAPANREDELKQFFVGSDPQIFHVSYPGMPVNHIKGLLSRYGFSTICGGCIYAEVNVCYQRELTASASKKTPRISDRKATILMNSVNHILEAFKKARQRMLLAREPILLQGGNGSEVMEEMGKNQKLRSNRRLLKKYSSYFSLRIKGNEKLLIDFSSTEVLEKCEQFSRSS